MIEFAGAHPIVTLLIIWVLAVVICDMWKIAWSSICGAKRKDGSTDEEEADD